MSANTFVLTVHVSNSYHSITWAAAISSSPSLHWFLGIGGPDFSHLSMLLRTMLSIWSMVVEVNEPRASQLRRTMVLEIDNAVTIDRGQGVVKQRLNGAYEGDFQFYRHGKKLVSSFLAPEFCLQDFNKLPFLFV